MKGCEESGEVSAGCAGGTQRRASAYAVDRDLVDVRGRQAVHLGISIEECAPLQKCVWGQLDARHERSRRKSGLLYVSVVVFWVPVEDELADRLQR